MSRYIRPFCLLVVLSVGGCGYQWKDYKSDAGNYSCLLPGNVKTESKTAPVLGATLTVQMASVNLKNAAFGVGYFDLPRGAPYDYDAGINGILAGGGGTLNYKKECTVDGMKAYEFEGTITKPKNGFLACRLVRHKDRMYELLVVGSNTKASNKDVQKFWDSFKLLKK